MPYKIFCIGLTGLLKWSLSDSFESSEGGLIGVIGKLLSETLEPKNGLVVLFLITSIIFNEPEGFLRKGFYFKTVGYFFFY